MKESNATTTLYQTIPSRSERELIALLFTAVQRIENKGYSSWEIEKMITEAMNQILPNSLHPRLMA